MFSAAQSPAADAAPNASAARAQPAGAQPDLDTLERHQLQQLVREQAITIEALRERIDWFTNQLFGRKSERWDPQPDGLQMHLGELGLQLPVPEQAEPAADVTVHKRRRPRTDFGDERASAPFFDASKVPVVTIEVACPEAKDLRPDQYEVIGHKESHRLAQRPGSYVVLKYRRELIKLREPSADPAPDVQAVEAVVAVAPSSACVPNPEVVGNGQSALGSEISCDVVPSASSISADRDSADGIPGRHTEVKAESHTESHSESNANVTAKGNGKQAKSSQRGAGLYCAAAPVSVIEGSRADVSFLVGLLLDKFLWHLPFYRQHQRLLQDGFRLSRPWLTTLASQTISLLEPIFDAMLESIRCSRVRTVDETTIKAGREGPGKLHSGYFWPVYGEHDEICFVYCDSRAHHHVFDLLGPRPRADAVLISDGYGAYEAYARHTNIVHAQCWTHMRRNFFDAQAAAPTEADRALRLIAPIYAVEAEINKRELKGADKQQYRQQHARPHVDRFFEWAQRSFDAQGLLPSNKLTQALAYALPRKAALQVYLDDPEVSIDTNHIERAIRPIAMGRRNWLFCWTELGAKQVGIVQSLIATCRLHGVDPYTYFVDVLQRVAQHPASRVAELTPRLWKQHFAHAPLRSDLYKAGLHDGGPNGAVN